MGETGLLDFLKSPEGQGLLAAGFGAMGSRNPWVGMSRGGLLGLQAYGQASEMQADRQRQQAMDERQTQVFDWQKSAHEQQQEAMRKAQEQQAAQQNYLGSLGKVTSPRLDAQPNQADPRQMLGMGFDPKFIETYMNADNLGKAKIKDFKEIRNPDGSVSVVGFDEFGNITNTKQTPFKAPDVRDFGGYVGGVDPITGEVTNYGQKTMSASERDASARGWAGVNLQREQANRDAQAVTYQQDADGNFVALPTKIQPGSVVRGLPVVSGPGMSPLKGASKLGEGQKKQISGIESLSNAVNAYTSAVDQWDNKKFLNPNERAKMGTLYNNMMLQAKEAYNLGVLNGPDYDILQSVIKDPTTAGALLVSNDTLKGQATTLRDMMQKNIGSIRNPGNQQPQGEPSNGGKTVVKTGTFNGRKVVQYSDGTTAYVD